MSSPLANRRSLRALLLFIAIHAIASCSASESAVVDPRSAELRQVELAAQHLPERHRIAVIGAGYDQMAAAIRRHKKLSELSDKDVEVLYRAAQLAAFYTHDPRHVRDMESYLDALQGRGLASSVHHVQMYGTFIGARMLAEARALAARHPLPELELLPALREAADIVPGSPTEWSVNPNKRELLRRAADVRGPVQLVVISHPLCHFSKAAMHDIQADPLLAEVFRTHARWLAPQDSRLRFDAIQQWNAQHPDQEITLAFRRDEWPMIDSWATPTFYVLSNGVVTAKLEGWPRAGRRSELLAALRQVDVLQ